jgi:hypothetical protein
MGAVLCYGVVPHAARCQSKLPVPEFYGIYAVTDGHLIKLGGKEIRTDKNVPVPIGQRQSVANILNGASVASSQTVALPVFSPDVKIIVYSETGGMMTPLQVAEPLRIEPLVFVRKVSVDTGFPNNVRRSGAENGWEYGTAPELLGLATGDHPEALELLKKPFPGQKDMVIAGFAGMLAAGVYRFTLEPGGDIPGMGGGNFFTFAVEPMPEAASAKCVDASVTYAMMVSNVKYRPCGSRVPSEASSGAPGEAPTPGSGAPKARPVAECSDYANCMSQGSAAYGASAWDSATGFFEIAAKKRPESAETWDWLAKLALRSGQPGHAFMYWDNLLKVGGAVAISACHERGIKRCEPGTISVSAKEVSFTTADGQKVLGVPPSQVTPKVLEDLDIAHVSFNLQVQKKNNRYAFVPAGIACEMAISVFCPPDGTAQQRSVSAYVSRTISRLAAGPPQI